MADEYLVKGESIKGIADTIRTKTSTTAQISFPDGFKTAISGIKTEKPEQEKQGLASPDVAVVVTPDSGKVLSKVTIEKIPYATGSSGVDVDESDPFKAYIHPLIEEAGYISDSNMESFAEVIDAFPAKTIVPSTSDTLVCPNNCYVYDIGEEGLTVKGDPNLLSGNIRSGVSIFGVSGNKNVIDTTSPAGYSPATSSAVLYGNRCYVNGSMVEGGMLTITPNVGASVDLTTGEISPYASTVNGHVVSGTYQGEKISLSKYTGVDVKDLRDVGDNYMVYVYADGNSGGFVPKSSTYIIGDGYISKSTIASMESGCKAENIKSGVAILGVDGTFTSDATATSDKILKDETAYVKGQKVTGTIPSLQGGTVTPGTAATTAVAAGTYAAGDIEVAGDANLVAENIKKGVSIFGVAGTAITPSGTIVFTQTSRIQTFNVTNYASAEVHVLQSKAEVTREIDSSTDEVVFYIDCTSSGYISIGRSTSGTLRYEPIGSIDGDTIITPTTSNKLIASDGDCAVGDVYIQGDANLKAANIKKGVSIFGVTGTLDSPIEWTTWTFKDSVDISGWYGSYYENSHTFPVPAIIASSGQLLKGIEIDYSEGSSTYETMTYFYANSGSTRVYYSVDYSSGWNGTTYKTIKLPSYLNAFIGITTGSWTEYYRFMNWLNENATKSL